MKRDPFRAWGPTLLLSLCLLAGCGKGAGEWAGSISEADGVKIVKNPIEPRYAPEAFIREEDLSIGESEGREEYMFQQITDIAVDPQENIYVIDYGAKQVKVFDKQGRHVRTFGKAGEGPGEFQLPRTIECTPWDEIIVGDINRITHFDLEGQYQSSLPMSRVRLLGLRHNSGGDILGLVIDRDNEVYQLQKFDKDLNHLVSFASSPLPSSGEFRARRSLYFPVLRWDVLNNGNVVCGYAGEGYVIHVFDGSGKLLRRIEKEFVPVEVDQVEAEEELNAMPAEVRDSYYAPKDYPPFRFLSSDDQGRVFVLTYEKSSYDKGYMFDVFDSEGIYIVKLSLESRPRCFRNGKMYTVEEDAEGFHVLKRYAIGWNLE